MKLQSSTFHSLEQVQSQYLGTKPVQHKEASAQEGYSFQEILEKKSNPFQEVRFSKHASNRLSTRNIELTDTQMERLEEGTRKAKAKGIRDSLVLVDSLAFIVNVPSSTVVTAMEQSEAQENIFTNIDGAVII